MIKTKFIISVLVSLALLFLLVTDGHARIRRHKTVKTDTVKVESKYAKLLKGASTQNGMFKIHIVKTNYYFELPDSLMGRDILIVNKVSGVPYELNDAGLNKGMGYEEKIVRFYRDSLNDKVWVMTYNPKVSVPEGDVISRSVYDNHRESVIEFFPIEAYSPDSNGVVIKINKVFDGSEKSFNDLYNSISLRTSVNKSLSKIERIKSFPQNIVVKSLLSSQVTEGGESLPLTVEATTNLVLLPKVPMKSRWADPRVGFFTSDHVYFNDGQQRVDKRELVHRWRLEPKPEDVEKYKGGELVEPVKPIVFYIDPATPKQWRDEIKAGVFDWQVAFEAAGFKNAILAKEVSEDDKDFDIEDVRYSVITYAASQQANAMGPSVVDPRSGEIIEADIVWWHNVMSLLHTWIRVQTAPIDERARANKLSDEHMASAIRFVSSHELGHTLGLKHNMGASYAFPVDSLRSPVFTAKMGGTASSIMDYARFNYVAQPEDGVKDITPVIGAYDKHAINWAYRWLDVQTPQEELSVLNAWLREHEDNRMYWYGEQQDPRDPVDPRSQDEDLGDDAVKASRYGVMNLKRIVPNIEQWTEEEGEGYFKAGELLMAVINQWKMYAGHVTANIGGFYINNPVKGQQLDRYVAVPGKKQKESVRYLIEEVFMFPEWLYEADIWKKSYPVRNSPEGAIEYAPYNVARELQYAVFYELMKDARLTRMYEAEAMPGNKDIYSPEQMFSDLHQAVFKGSIAGRKLTLQERMTQKNYIDAIIVSSNKAVEKTTKKKLSGLVSGHTCCYASRKAEIVVEQPEETALRTLHYYSMGRVAEPVSVKRGALLKVLKLAESRRLQGDAATQNHYEDLIVRIKEALNL